MKYDDDEVCDVCGKPMHDGKCKPADIVSVLHSQWSDN